MTTNNFTNMTREDFEKFLSNKREDFIQQKKVAGWEFSERVREFEDVIVALFVNLGTTQKVIYNKKEQTVTIMYLTPSDVVLMAEMLKEVGRP